MGDSLPAGKGPLGEAHLCCTQHPQTGHHLTTSACTMVSSGSDIIAVHRHVQHSTPSANFMVKELIEIARAARALLATAHHNDITSGGHHPQGPPGLPSPGHLPPGRVNLATLCRQTPIEGHSENLALP